MTYDLVTGQRTFYLGLSGVSPNPNNVIHDVIFRDSGGNDIKCSYFRINALVDATVANSGAWAAELSGIPHTGDMLTDSLSSVSNTVATSGICGIGGAMGPIGSIPHEWHGSNGQVCTGIKLQVMSEGPWFIGITYGNLFPLNTIRTTNSLVYDAGV